MDLFFSDETTQMHQSIRRFLMLRSPVLEDTPPGDCRPLIKSSGHARNLTSSLLDWAVRLHELK